MTAIDWYDPAKQLPEENEECLLMPHENGGLLTVAVFGPIRWHAQSQCWLDLFRDPEAGAMIAPHDVGCWCAWDAVKPSDESGLPTPRTEMS